MRFNRAVHRRVDWPQTSGEASEVLVGVGGRTVGVRLLGIPWAASRRSSAMTSPYRLAAHVMASRPESS